MDENQKASKVYFTDFRCRPDEGRTDKLKRLIKAAGFDKIDMDGKFVAIKMRRAILRSCAPTMRAP